MTAAVEVDERPLSASERAELASRAADAEAWTAEDLRERARGWSLLGAATTLAFSLVGWVAVIWEQPALAMAALGGALATGVAASVDLARAWRRRREITRAWADNQHKALTSPVRVVTAHVRNALALTDGYWLFELEDGRWMLVPELVPGFEPARVVRWAMSAGGFSWLSAEGPVVPVADRAFSLEALPDGHPLRDGWGPAIYAPSGDPVAGLASFEAGGFPLG